MCAASAVRLLRRSPNGTHGLFSLLRGIVGVTIQHPFPTGLREWERPGSTLGLGELRAVQRRGDEHGGGRGERRRSWRGAGRGLGSGEH